MESRTVTLFDISNPTKVVQRQSLNIGGRPHDLTYLPDASKVYVSVPDANKITVLNAHLELIEREIRHSGISDPVGVTTNADGSYLFVANRNSSGSYSPRQSFPGEGSPGTLVVIDTVSDTVVKVIELGSGAAMTGSRFVVGRR